MYVVFTQNLISTRNEKYVKTNVRIQINKSILRKRKLP